MLQRITILFKIECLEYHFDTAFIDYESLTECKIQNRAGNRPNVSLKIPSWLEDGFEQWSLAKSLANSVPSSSRQESQLK